MPMATKMASVATLMLGCSNSAAANFAPSHNAAPSVDASVTSSVSDVDMLGNMYEVYSDGDDCAPLYTSANVFQAGASDSVIVTELPR